MRFFALLRTFRSLAEGKSNDTNKREEGVSVVLTHPLYCIGEMLILEIYFFVLVIFSPNPQAIEKDGFVSISCFSSLFALPLRTK